MRRWASLSYLLTFKFPMRRHQQMKWQRLLNFGSIVITLSDMWSYLIKVTTFEKVKRSVRPSNRLARFWHNYKKWEIFDNLSLSDYIGFRISELVYKQNIVLQGKQTNRQSGRHPQTTMIITYEFQGNTILKTYVSFYRGVTGTLRNDSVTLFPECRRISIS